MKLLAHLAFAAALIVSPGIALAQNEEHHDDPAAGEHSAPATTGMPQQCGPMMQMMQGAMGEHMAACMSNMPAASRAYMGAMMNMHGPMMEAMQASDPDVAFVKGMIPHHQAAIDMARAALEHGADEQARKWAQEIIDAQQAEIDAMQDWLQQRDE